MFDGSYLRLKNAEIAYTIRNSIVKRLGIESLRIYLNGNNLAVWSKMPDDRGLTLPEQAGLHKVLTPTVKRYSLGVIITF